MPISSLSNTGKRLLLSITLCLLTIFFPLVGHANQNKTTTTPVPTPLSLEQAISYASSHPRTRLTKKQLLQYPGKQALFMDCHNLAFTNTQSIDSKRNSVETSLIGPVEQQKLIILQRFFDVLIADINLAYINEKMAGSYVDYDRKKTRFELKQVSELEVAKLDAEYQTIRQQFYASQATQRVTRSLLAQAINHPDNLPSDLISPDKVTLPKTLPEVTQIFDKAIQNNAWINNLTKTGNNDQIALMKMDLSQQILELLMRMNILKSAKQRADKENLHRELNLDLSRSLYEMEVKANLGDSMALQTRAQMEDKRFDYCQLLTWAQLNVLQGLPLFGPPLSKQPK